MLSPALNEMLAAMIIITSCRKAHVFPKDRECLSISVFLKLCAVPSLREILCVTVSLSLQRRPQSGAQRVEVTCLGPHSSVATEAKLVFRQGCAPVPASWLLWPTPSSSGAIGCSKILILRSEPRKSSRRAGCCALRAGPKSISRSCLDGAMPCRPGLRLSVLRGQEQSRRDSGHTGDQSPSQVCPVE